MKNKKWNFFTDFLLFFAALVITDNVMLYVFHSENLWVEIFVYVVICGIVFGVKNRIVSLRRNAK